MALNAVRSVVACGARLSRSLLIGFAFLLTCEPVLAQTQTADKQQDEEAVRGRVVFDILSQPLETALTQFRAVAGIELFYESNVVRGKRSSAVSGMLPVEAAMRLLLRETGLFSTSFDRNTITILQPTDADVAVGLARAKAQVAEFGSYLARLQRMMDRAFCGGSPAAGDPEDILIRLWIAPSGKISRTELLLTTGSDQRDRAYVTVIGALAVDLPPPATMPQPVNMIIGARTVRISTDCPPAIELRSARHD